MNPGSQMLILETYAIVSALWLVALTVLSAKKRTAPLFRELNAERINIVGPDGKLKLTISNRERLPEPIMEGKTFKREGAAPGMIFYNDEGDENGGLIFGGKKENGRPNAGASLTFDQYHQDMSIALQYIEEDGKRRAYLKFTDYPDISIPQVQAMLEKYEESQREAVQNKMWEEGLFGRERVYIGRDGEKTAKVVLSDANGKPRLIMQTAAEGNPEIIFMNAEGKITNRIGQ